jgi:hypothetical protein
MADVYKKAKLGYEDIHFDTQGSGATTQTLRSNGTYRTVQKLNASHVPISATARAKKQASGAAVGTTDVDGTLVQVLDDLEDLGQPDATTLENSSGTLRVKDLGVTAAKLAANAVTTAKILDDNVTNAKLAANAVAGSAAAASGDNVIEAGSIDTADLADDAVTADKILDGTIVNDKISDATIKAAKLVDVPTHYVVKCGEASLAAAGVGASDTVAEAGIVATDIIQVTIKSITNAVYLKTATAGENKIDLVFSGAPGVTVVYYTVFRAVTA